MRAILLSSLCGEVGVEVPVAAKSGEGQGPGGRLRRRARRRALCRACRQLPARDGPEQGGVALGDNGGAVGQVDRGPRQLEAASICSATVGCSTPGGAPARGLSSSGAGAGERWRRAQRRRPVARGAGAQNNGDGRAEARPTAPTLRVKERPGIRAGSRASRPPATAASAAAAGTRQLRRAPRTGTTLRPGFLHRPGWSLRGRSSTRHCP